MRTSIHVQYDTKTIQLLRGLKLYRKLNTKFENVAKVQDKQVANLQSNVHIYHRNLTVPYKYHQLWQVAKLQGLPHRI